MRGVLAGLRRVARARAGGTRGRALLLVSEENVLGSMQAALSGAGFYADAGARVAAVAEAFGAHRLTIAMAMRAQDAWWRSVDAFAGRLGMPTGACAVRRWRRSRATGAT
jgi:hypothetical protein